MKTLLASLAAAGLVFASAGAGLTCPYNSASVKNKMTIADSQQEQTEEAASTFDPARLPLDEEESAE